MNEPEPPRKGRFAAFWTSLPGILTAIATLVAIAGLLALFVVPGDSGDSGPNRAEWAAKVDPICSDASNAVRQLPAPTADVNSRADYLRQVGRIARDTSEKVGALEAPTEVQGSIDRMTALWDQQADGADTVANALQSGNYEDAQNVLGQVLAAETGGDALANSLGVKACAQRPPPSTPF
jgi:hypothetical protein